MCFILFKKNIKFLLEGIQETSNVLKILKFQFKISNPSKAKTKLKVKLINEILE